MTVMLFRLLSSCITQKHLKQIKLFTNELMTSVINIRKDSVFMTGVTSCSNKHALFIYAAFLNISCNFITAIQIVLIIPRLVTSRPF